MPVANALLPRRFLAKPWEPLDDDDSQAMIRPIHGTDVRLLWMELTSKDMAQNNFPN
jgi:hypothetical protein